MTTTTFNLTTGHSGPGTTIIVQGHRADMAGLMPHHVHLPRPMRAPSKWKANLLHIAASIVTIVAALFKGSSPAY